MDIIRTKDGEFSSAYGLLCQPAINKLFESDLPFGSKLCVVKPGMTSIIHNHHEYECFFITKGAGNLTIGDEFAEVAEGDIIRISPFLDHTIHNPDAAGDLHFLTIWWEDLRALASKRDSAPKDAMTLVFSTPPTPNGDLHLGHLSGPYTGADIYRRFLELTGGRAFHVTGRDDNQSYVPRKALDQGRPPQALADDYSDRMERTLARNAVRIDHYGHPGKSPYHVDLTKRVVRELYAKGFIYERESEALFCRETGKYLYEAHVRGLCPHCNAESDGNACEQCGRPNDVANLINPQSKYGKQGVDIRKVKRLYFKLSAFAEPLRQYHRKAIMPAHLASLCERMLEDGLPDICVSHLTDWGIPVPVEKYEDQRIYVWFEMAAGYLAAAQETAEKFNLSEIDSSGWKRFYSSDAARLVHFFGFDNGYFHTLLFPAIFIALDWNIRLPEGFVVNELLNLDGLKFSTSRGHLIWGSDLLNLVPADYVRYYLSYVRPETEKTNFTIAEFVSVIHDELAGRWQLWLKAMATRCQINFGGKIPPAGVWGVEHRCFLDSVTQILSQARQAYQAADFSPQRVCRLANELVRETTRFAASQSHYVGSKSTYDLSRTGMALEFLAAKALAIIMQPIMPGFSDSLWRSLERDLAMAWPEVPNFVRDGRVFAMPHVPFFTTVPDSVYDLRR